MSTLGCRANAAINDDLAQPAARVSTPVVSVQPSCEEPIPVILESDPSYLINGLLKPVGAMQGS
jgi:hypothetical protein